MKRLCILSAWLLGAPALPQPAPPPSAPSPTSPAGDAVSGSSASITLGSGPHKGRYDFAPTEACVITAFGKKPMGLSVVFTSDEASMSLDVPNIDEKHASEIQVVLVVSDVAAGATRKGTSSVTYEIDTRPDAALEPYQRAERANKGISGKATSTLMQKAGFALLSFSGETQTGVKLSGEVNCRKVEAG